MVGGSVVKFIVKNDLENNYLSFVTPKGEKYYVESIVLEGGGDGDIIMSGIAELEGE
jgi:hypothetical protein